MESVDKQIKEFFENRINENIDLPFPSNMDLFFWGDKKDINLVHQYKAGTSVNSHEFELLQQAMQKDNISVHWIS